MKPVVVGRSRPMRELVAELRRFARADATILLIGETGVGKDTLARLAHHLSPRHAEPFVTVDCAALPATLFEAELFGHERGAFTDATVARPGRFELAGAGTIYLDRVTALPLVAQGALLRVVEEKRVERLGGTRSLVVRARVIASADADLHQAVHDGRFRADLFHRLGVLPLAIPPLRERPDDIVPMAQRFAREAAARLGRPVPRLDADVRLALRHYAWPGNGRELRHTIDRAVLAGADTLALADLPDEIVTAPAAAIGADATDAPTLDELERRYILLTLRRTRGSQTRAAAILGISRKALWEKRKRHGIE